MDIQNISRRSETRLSQATSHKSMRVPAIILVAVLALSAQEDLPRRSDIVVTTKVVIAPTTVTDNDGRFINGLQVNDFVLTDNDKPQRITQDIEFQPLSMVVAVQANAQVEGLLPKLQKIGAAINALVAGDTGEVAVIGFDHRIQTLQEFTSDPNKLDLAFKKLKPGSSSAVLNDTTMHAINLLRNRPQNRRRVILLISETRDVAGSMHPREVLSAAQFANVLIYSINISRLMSSVTRSAPYTRPDPIPPEARRSPTGGVMTPTQSIQMSGTGNFIPLFVEIFKGVKGVFVDNPSELYTKYTGGREYSFASQRALEQAITEIGEELHSQYLLSYTPSNLDEAGFHTIDVKVKGRPNLKIRTRPGYWIAGGAQ
jgi:VWFA-related protein